jgi:hypothetical protein
MFNPAVLVIAITPIDIFPLSPSVVQEGWGSTCAERVLT